MQKNQLFSEAEERKGIESCTKTGTRAEYILSGSEGNEGARGGWLTQSLPAMVGHRPRWVMHTPKLPLTHGISGQASLTPNKNTNNCHPLTLLVTLLTFMRSYISVQ